MENHKIAYFFLRLAMGVNLFGHGLARIPKLQAVAAGMVQNFKKSWLPQNLVQVFGNVLPFVELVIRLMLIIGYKTKWANWAGATLIITLLFGSSTIENWEAMGTQMVYAFMFYFLIAKQQDNIYSLDKINLK